MKRVEVNPNNEKYYTKDFISGFRCGTKRQFESDLAILDKIRAEIEQIIGERNLDDYDFCSGLICARKIIDKYRESEG